MVETGKQADTCTSTWSVLDRGKGKHATQAQEVREGFLGETMPEPSLERWAGSRQEDKGCRHQGRSASLPVSSTA